MTLYYCSHSKCGKVRMIVAPFGYGPKVAAETMANLLNLSLGEWKLHTTDNYNKRFEVTYNFGVAQPNNEPDTSFKIWVDCLMWLRNEIPPNVRKYDLFLAEKFFPINPILLQQANEKKIKEIPPLYSLNGKSNSVNKNKFKIKEEYILVSFGGVETPFTTDVHRYAIPTTILEALVTASQKFNDKRKIVCCLPAHILKSLKENQNLSSIQFLSPNHEEFLQILNNSSLYIVQPGLYGPFEAFENEIPTAFTTPFSYTQVCQLKAYVKESLAGHVPLWTDLESSIGSLKGNIESEEEVCFQKMSTWIRKKNLETNSNEYSIWAEKVLNDEIISEELISKRVQHIEQSKKNTYDYFQENNFLVNN